MGVGVGVGACGCVGGGWWGGKGSGEHTDRLYRVWGVGFGALSPCCGAGRHAVGALQHARVQRARCTRSHATHASCAPVCLCWFLRQPPTVCTFVPAASCIPRCHGRPAGGDCLPADRRGGPCQHPNSACAPHALAHVSLEVPAGCCHAGAGTATNWAGRRCRLPCFLRPRRCEWHIFGTVCKACMCSKGWPPLPTVLPCLQHQLGDQLDQPGRRPPGLWPAGGLSVSSTHCRQRAGLSQPALNTRELP